MLTTPFFLWFLLLLPAFIATGEDICGSSSLPCTAGCWDASRTTSGARLCRPVGLGYFSSIFDDHRYPCPPGSSSDNTTTARLCRPCQPGTYSYGAAGVCMDCPSGSFAAFVGAEYCDSCDPRHYNGSGSASVLVLAANGTEIVFCRDPVVESTFYPAPRFVSLSPSVHSAPGGMTSRSPSTTLPASTGSTTPPHTSFVPSQSPMPGVLSRFPSPSQTSEALGYTGFPENAPSLVPDASQGPTVTKRHSAYPTQTLGPDNETFLYDLSVQNFFVAGVVIIIFFCMIVLVCCCKPAQMTRARQSSALPPANAPVLQQDDESVHSTYYDDNDDAIEQETKSLGTLDDISLMDRSPMYFEQLQRSTGLAFGLDENELLQAQEYMRAEPDESVAGASLWNYSVAGGTIAVVDEDANGINQTGGIEIML